MEQGTEVNNKGSQEEEVTVLSSAYPELTTSEGTYTIPIQVNSPNDSTPATLSPLILQWTYPEDYPSSVAPQFTLQAEWLTESDATILTKALTSMYETENPRRVVIFNWILWLKDNTLSTIGRVPNTNDDSEGSEGDEEYDMHFKQDVSVNKAAPSGPKKKKKQHSNVTDPYTESTSTSSQSKAKKKKGQKSKEEPEKKKSMRTSEDVYNRIKWDPDLNKEDFLIGYTDRFVGIKEATFESWEHGDVTDEVYIPWHRVQYFKKNGEIVWDRRTREDKIFNAEKQSKSDNNNKAATQASKTVSKKATKSTPSPVKNEPPPKPQAVPSIPSKAATKQSSVPSDSLEKKKTVQSAVVISPPENLWSGIQAIRKNHDKSYLRWMPHINLLYPFVPIQKFDEAAVVLQKAVANIKPFKVKFNKINCFIHEKSCSIWLDPETEKGTEIKELQKCLEMAYPFCNDLSRKSDEGFTGHLTVGVSSKQNVKQDMESFQQNWKPIEWTVSEIYLINRDGDVPFSKIYRIPFGVSKPEKIENGLYIAEPHQQSANNNKGKQVKKASALAEQKRGGRGGQKAVVTQTCLYSFDAKTNDWIEYETEDHNVTLDTIKVITFNVLFDYHYSELIFSSKRLLLLCDVLKQYDADLVCLQEVTPQFLHSLISVPYIRDNYKVSDKTGSTVENYGQILLSKIPVTKIYAYKDSTKPSLIAELCVNGEAVVMPIIHLTSDRSTNPEKKRATQLENLFVYSKQFPHTILVGDFNFGDGPEQDAVNWGQYKDVWLELHANDVGFTFDPSKNSLANITSESKKQRRLDRIIVRSDKLKGTRIEIIGNKGTTIKLSDAEKEQCKSESDELVLYPSDHFGLYCELSVNK